MSGGPDHDGPLRPPTRWTASLCDPIGDDQRFTVVRLIPEIASGEAWWQRGSVADVAGQLAVATQVIAGLDGDPLARIAAAPAGWLRIPWPLEPSVGLPPIAADSAATRYDATPYLEPLARFLEQELGERLAALPVRHICFGADFTSYGVDPADFSQERYGWEVQGLFVYAPGSARIRHATTSFAGVGSWRSWLLASHHWESHFCRLDGVGGTLLLGGHDLTSMAESRAAPKGHLKERRKAIRRLIDDKKPSTLLHLAHVLEDPSGRADDLDSLIASAPAAAFKRAASVGRWSRSGEAIEASPRDERLARGFRDRVVVLRPDPTG